MVVADFLKGEKRLIYQALAYSPLSGAVCLLRGIQQTFSESFAVLTV